MGLLVNVYRDSNSDYDCTMNGVTKRHTQLCVVNVDGPFEPSIECPAVMLVDDQPCGRPYPKLVPADALSENKWTMFGGNYAQSSDSRFTDAVEKMGGPRAGILPVFDRIEG